VTATFVGTLYRCVPASSVDPMSVTFSLRGGRWNPPGTFAVLYTFLSASLARTFIRTQWAKAGTAIEDLQPQALPDLLVLNCSVTGLTDITTPTGLQNVGLPAMYPVGFESEASWPVTQQIGVRLHGSGSAGVLTRSATATTWTGPQENWAEIAIFPDNAPLPTLTERIPAERWL